ncbi:hypothetical protein [Thermus sp.]|uniref:hypothetical protein n=1 Tax=Thermus sp. TaxID=275 RepID=UPI003D13A1A4
MAEKPPAFLLDASALLAYLQREPGFQAVRVAREVEEAVGELKSLVSRLYALEARLKAPHGQRSYLADKSAALLRELFGGF